MLKVRLFLNYDLAQILLLLGRVAEHGRKFSFFLPRIAWLGRAQAELTHSISCNPVTDVNFKPHLGQLATPVFLNLVHVCMRFCVCGE